MVCPRKLAKISRQEGALLPTVICWSTLKISRSSRSSLPWVAFYLCPKLTSYFRMNIWYLCAFSIRLKSRWGGLSRMRWGGGTCASKWILKSFPLKLQQRMSISSSSKLCESVLFPILSLFTAIVVNSLNWNKFLRESYYRDYMHLEMGEDMVWERHN